MSQRIILRQLVQSMVDIGAIAIRDVDGGETPFEYSSGNFGPGYVMVKGLVTQKPLLEAMVYHLAYRVVDVFPEVEYVAGNATGGMIPAWIMAEALTTLLNRRVEYFYVRNTRKIGGHGELITGDNLNAFFVSGRRGIVMEELVNFADTTCNSAIVQREKGYVVDFAATLLNYDHAKSRERLTQEGVELISLFRLAEVLDIVESEQMFSPHLVKSWRDFLKDPMGWQSARGIVPKQREKVHG